MRMCAACRARHPKLEMVRIVLTKNGTLDIDENGRMGGRGVNICASESCFEKAFEIKAFDKIWSGSQGKTDMKAIRAKMDDVMGQKAFRLGGDKVTYRVAKQEAELYVGHPVTRAS